MVELYDHQRKAVDALASGRILWGDVGTGKSLTALAYYVEKQSPRRLIVITTAKKRDSLDWQKDAARFAIGRTSSDTAHGTITVDSWNNVGDYAGIEDAFFIFDEQRIVGSGAWTNAFIRISRKNTWILCTATPGDTWLDYIPVFVAAGYFKNRTQFFNDHVVFNRFSKFPKVERYTNVGKLVRFRNEMLVEMPYDRHTTRKTEIVEVPHDVPKFEKVLNDRWHVFESRPLRDVAELFLVMRRVVNTDSSRVQAVRGLLKDHPKLIVFYNHDFELELLRSLGPNSKNFSENGSWIGSGTTSADTADTERIDQWNGISTTTSPSTPETSSRADTFSDTKLLTERSGDLPTSSSSSPAPTLPPNFQVAEWNGHLHQPIPTSDRWVYLVQYQAGAEGWNCIETDAICFYSLTYSYKLWHQAHGRIDRLNTPFEKLYYYVLMSNSVIDKAIWRSLMGKKGFNETRFLSKIIDTEGREAA